MLSKPQPKIEISRIVVGERHRRDHGDIDALAASITEIGLLQPVVIRPDGTLIAGERRLHAARRLGWREIPVHVIDLDAVVRGEYAENACRKDFTLSEAVAIKRALEPVEREAARIRMRAGRPLENFSEGRALDKIAEVTGVHRTTLAKAEAIVDAAEAEPERFGKLLADMDRTGRANGPFKRLKVIQQAEQIRREPPPLPNRGPYRVAVCDMPWPSDPDDPDSAPPRGFWPFPTMSLDQIGASLREIAAIMHEDCVLWFFVTNFHLQFAHPLLHAAGFTRTSTMMTWGKDRIGRGQDLRGQTEHAIMAKRGRPIITLTNQSTLLLAPVRAPLGTKPPEFYDMVESLCPAPRYADFFSRYRHNDKWDCHGDEAPQEQPNATEPPEPVPDGDLDMPDFLDRRSAR